MVSRKNCCFQDRDDRRLRLLPLLVVGGEVLVAAAAVAAEAGRDDVGGAEPEPEPEERAGWYLY